MSKREQTNSSIGKCFVMILAARVNSRLHLNNCIVMIFLCFFFFLWFFIIWTSCDRFDFLFCLFSWRCNTKCSSLRLVYRASCFSVVTIHSNRAHSMRKSNTDVVNKLFKLKFLLDLSIICLVNRILFNYHFLRLEAILNGKRRFRVSALLDDQLKMF